MLDIKILGPGCQKCHQLADEVERYLEGHHLNARVERVTKFFDIARWSVVQTPGLVVNGRVVMTGRVPNEIELSEWLCEIEPRE